jgi:hypothetical protein
MENNFNFSFIYLSVVLSFNGLCNEPPPPKKNTGMKDNLFYKFVSYFTRVFHPEGETWVEILRIGC